MTVSAENGQVERQKNERQKELFVPSVGLLKLKLKREKEGREGGEGAAENNKDGILHSR